jgi:hypothetical protein
MNAILEAENSEIFWNNLKSLIAKRGLSTFKALVNHIEANMTQYKWVFAMTAFVKFATYVLSPGGTPTTTATLGPSTTSSEPTATPTEWLMVTTRGTSLKLYNGLVLGAGTEISQITFPNVEHQGLVANLTSDEADVVGFLPFIAVIGLNDPWPDTGFDNEPRSDPITNNDPDPQIFTSDPTSIPTIQASPIGSDKDTDTLLKRQSPFGLPSDLPVYEQGASPIHLNRISQSQDDIRAGRLSNYQWRGNVKQKTRLYIIDNGFNITHRVCYPSIYCRLLRL